MDSSDPMKLHLGCSVVHTYLVVDHHQMMIIDLVLAVILHPQEL